MLLLGLEAKHPAGAAMAGIARKGDRASGDVSARESGRPAAPALVAVAKDPGLDIHLEAEWTPLPDDKVVSTEVIAESAMAELPDFSESLEIDSASFGAVLPEREPAVLPVEPPVAGSGRVRLEGRRAIAPAAAPSPVKTAIAAANHLQTKP